MKSLMTFALLLCAALMVHAQRFSPSFVRFSKKQTAYITLEDGTELREIYGSREG